MDVKAKVDYFTTMLLNEKEKSVITRWSRDLFWVNGHFECYLSRGFWLISHLTGQLNPAQHVFPDMHASDGGWSELSLRRGLLSLWIRRVQGIGIVSGSFS